MRVTQRTITARFTRPGFHCWPEAPGPRGYLAHPHRHLFHVEASVTVTHDDREVEFHDLLDAAAAGWPDQLDLGRRSCEQLAEAVAARIDLTWPGRQITVAVYEDNEVGATITFQGEP